MNRLMKKQQGAILFVVLMIMLLMSILVLMGVRGARNDMKIGLAQAEQVAAFDQAEAMLSRVRFAMEQIPLPPSVALSSAPTVTNPPPAPGKDKDLSTVIWVTGQIASNVNTGNTNNINEPLFAQHGFEWDKGMTCKELDTWLKNKQSGVKLDCDGVFAPEKKQQPRIFIEFVTKQQSVGDIDSVRGAYFYRITILGKGFNSGRSIVQGVTGVEYI